MGLVGDGFVMMAADCSAARSILVFKQDVDKVIMHSSSSSSSSSSFYKCYSFR